MNYKKQRYVLITAGFITAICIELCLAFFTARHNYDNGEIFELIPEQVVHYSAYGDHYTRTKEDAWMEFSVGRSLNYLDLTFSEPVSEEMTLALYYTENQSQTYSRFRRVNRYLLKGTTKARISLPGVPCEKLRLDLMGDFALEEIKAGESLKEALTVRSVMSGIKPLRFFALLALLPAAFCLHGQRRGQRQSSVRKRMAYMDGVRVLAAFLVIAVHVTAPVALLQVKGTARNYLFQAVLLTALTCNLLFFFISGALLLQNKEETAGNFYRKRIVTIVVPFLVYSCFYLWTMCATVEGTKRQIAAALEAVLSGSIPMAPHLWLIYRLAAVYLFVPLFRKLLTGMTKRKEKILFFFILFLLGIRTVGLYRGTAFGFSLILDSWPGIFIAGYFLNRDWMRKYDGFLMAGGVTSLAAGLWLYSFRPDYQAIVTNCSILEFLMAAALFVLFIRLKDLFEWMGRGLAFLGKRSFSILLIHWFVFSGVITTGLIPESLFNRSVGELLLPFLLVSIISFALSWALDETVVLVLETGVGKILDKLEKKRALQNRH